MKFLRGHNFFYLFINLRKVMSPSKFYNLKKKRTKNHKMTYISVISTYINTKMSVCLSVCLSVHVFLGHFETDRETLWHKLAFCSWECSKTIIFVKILFFKELLPFFYISLRFLCKFEERL